MSVLRISLAATLSLGIFVAGVERQVHAAIWTGAVDNDVNNGDNWEGGGVPSATAADFSKSAEGNDSPNVSADWNPYAINFDATINSTDFPLGYTLSGDDGVTVTVGATNNNNTSNAGSIDSLGATTPVTISVTHLSVTKSGYISADGSDLHITSSTLQVGNFGSNASAFTLYADAPGGGNLFITPTVSLAGNNQNRSLVLSAEDGRLIHLAGGITGRSDASPTNVSQTKAGTTIVGGTSTNIGTTTISNGMFQIDGSYTTNTLQFGGAASRSITGTGTLVVGTDSAALKWINMGSTSAPISIDTANIAFNRGDSGIAGSSNADGDLTINSTSLKMGLGTESSSKNFIETNSGGGDITINPAVDFGDIEADQHLNLTARTDTAIRLNAGINGHGMLTTNVVVNGDGFQPDSQDGLVAVGGTSVFNGGTSVHLGAFQVNGTWNGSEAVTVHGPATLGGNGSIGSSVVIDGTVAPGTSVGTLSITGDVSINGTLLAEIENTSADLLAVVGSVTLDANSVLDLLIDTIDALATYDLITATEGIDGTFGSFTVPVPDSHVLVYSGNAVSLVPVPEPNACILAGIGLLGAAYGLRRRK